MKFIKPYHDGYLMVLGNGRTMSLTLEQLKVMSMAYDELRFVAKEHRKSFSLNDEPIEKLLAGIAERKKHRNDDFEGWS